MRAQYPASPLAPATAQKIIEAQSMGRRWGTGTGSGTVISDTSWVPLVDGSEPPAFITDGAGNLIFTAYTP